MIVQSPALHWASLSNHQPPVSDCIYISVTVCVLRILFVADFGGLFGFMVTVRAAEYSLMQGTQVIKRLYISASGNLQSSHTGDFEYTASKIQICIVDVFPSDALCCHIQAFAILSLVTSSQCLGFPL
jgi:hypothetical protein